MDVHIFERIVRNVDARRELLWLRAKEKEDDEAAFDLERIDPGIIERLRASGADIEERQSEGSRERRDRYGLAYDECFERHARDARAAAKARQG
jgi:hypothetical protein